MKLLFLSILSSICFCGCSMPCEKHVNSYSISYFDKGVKREVFLKDSINFVNLVKDLVKGTNNSFKMLVTKNIIEDAKLETCVEITFINDITVNTNRGKTISFSKILIPLKNESSSAVFYCGKENYYSRPPYINSDGFNIVSEIRKICENSICDKVE